MAVSGKQVLTVAGIVAGAFGLAMLINNKNKLAMLAFKEGLSGSFPGPSGHDLTPQAPSTIVLTPAQLEQLLAQRTVIDLQQPPKQGFPWL